MLHPQTVTVIFFVYHSKAHKEWLIGKKNPAETISGSPKSRGWIMGREEERDKIRKMD
jgi:hypothetical protein